jgi:hypothetical protein
VLAPVLVDGIVLLQVLALDGRARETEAHGHGR